MDKLDMRTRDLAKENYLKLKELFPEAVTETVGENGDIVRAIDADRLQELISGTVVDGPKERYQFTWPDKKKAIVLGNAPTTKTLRLVRDKSVGRDGTPGSIDTQNIYIEGDNLDALKLLRETYLGKVKMIYIDPPYNTGNDFVYKDAFVQSVDEYRRLNGQFDDDSNRLVENPESNGRFHTDWLNMLYPRLRLAKDFLTDDGAIFISIDDNEMHNLLSMCMDIFGASNFVGSFVWKRRTSSAMDRHLISIDHEYVLCFSRNPGISFLGKEKDYKGYSNPDNDPRGLWKTADLTVGMTSDARPNQFYDLVDPKTGKVYHPNPNRVWSYVPETMNKLIEEGRIIFPEDTSRRPMLKRYANELKITKDPFSSWMSQVGLNSEGTRSLAGLFDGVGYFNYAKPLSLLTLLIGQVASDATIMDFFSGSATLAQAVMELNATGGGVDLSSYSFRSDWKMAPKPSKPDSTPSAISAKSGSDAPESKYARIRTPTSTTAFAYSVSTQAI